MVSVVSELSKTKRSGPFRKISWRPLGGLLGPAVQDARQSLTALSFAAIASLATGLALAKYSQTFKDYQGLLLLLPAAIGLRGNVFGPFASRLSTAIQTGTFSWSFKRDSLLSQNILAVLAVSFSASICVGLFAKVIAEIALDSSIQVMSFLDFISISVMSAAIATLFLLLITLGLAIAAAKFNWDLDNVIAPIVSAAGDFVTLPALLLGVAILDNSKLRVVNIVFGILITVVLITVLFNKRNKVGFRIFKESLAVLAIAGFVSLLAGVVIESSSSNLLTYSILLVLLPGYLTIAGALGGILSNRLSTKVHLGLINPSTIPTGAARKDIFLTFQIALPIFLFLALVAQLVASIFGESSPGVFWIILVLLTGGLVATSFVAMVAYYGTLLIVKFGLDPDNHGIPIVSASLDLVGSATLIGGLIVWGVV